MKIKAHVGKAKKAAMEHDQQALHAANDFADELAKAGANLGVNEWLGYLGKACAEQAVKVTAALDWASALAPRLFKQSG